MPDFLAQVSTELLGGADVILGILIGGGITIITGYFADRRKFKREDRYRDHAERREAYAQFLAACDRIYRGERGSEPEKELRGAWMIVRLITQSEDVQRTCNDLFSGMVVYMNTEDFDARLESTPSIAQNMLDFVTAAREELDKPKLRPHRAKL